MWNDFRSARTRLPELTRFLWSIGVGAVIEIAILLALVPKDSTEPPTRFQEVLGQTQALWFGLASVFKDVDLPQPVNLAAALLLTATGFLLQSAIMALPIWLVLLVLSSRRRNV